MKSQKKWQTKEEKKWLQQDSMRIIIILISGRGRRRHFFVTPSVRTVRKLFDRYPTSMNIFCYGTLFSTADLSQQTIHHHYKVTKSLKRLNFTNLNLSNSFAACLVK